MNNWVATYDLGICPASWDFLTWLLNVEAERREANGGPIRVRFVKGPKNGFRDDGAARPLDQRRAILKNVMLPALKLVGAEQTTEKENQRSPSYLIKQTVRMARAGLEIPQWRVPDEAMQEVAARLAGRHPVVVTMREAEYYPERNSNVNVWIDWAKSCGEDVIFVRDTRLADVPVAGGIETAPYASTDFLLRAALMAQAKANLMVANGPIALAMFLPVPWLMFRPLTPALPTYRPARSGHGKSSASDTAAKSRGQPKNSVSYGAMIRSPTSNRPGPRSTATKILG